MTQPADKGPMPEQPKTQQLPALTDRALLESLVGTTKDIKGTVDGLVGTVGILVGDVGGLHTRMGSVEGRVAKLETPTIPPLTSTRVRSMTSEVDLKAHAELADEIVKRQAAEAEIAKLKEAMVTKDDLERATKDQTSAIVEGVKEAAKNPIIRKLGWALAGLILIAIQVATTYLTKGH